MTDFLKMYSTEDLEKVIADRKAEKAEIEKPTPIEKPDFDRILASAEKHIEYLASDDYCDDNEEEHYIYEDVMEAIYGKDVWDWINNR